MSPALERIGSAWAELIDQFVDWEASQQRSENQQHHLRYRIGLFAECIGGDPSLITRNDVDDWLATTPCSDLERRKRASALRVFFRWAVLQGYVSSNPTMSTYVRATPGPAREHFPSEWAAAFGDWAKFMKVGGKPETTIELRRMQIAKIGRELGGLGPWEVNRMHLVEWLASKDWGAQTRRSYRTTLRGFYNWAVAFELVKDDPTRGLPAVSVMQGVPRPAPDARITAAMEAATPEVRLMIRLAASMGLRRGEISRLHSNDITERGLIVRGKGNRMRLLPIPLLVAEALAPFMGRRDYVFTAGDGVPMTPGYIGKLMSSALGPGITAHMLRHRFASSAYAGERDLRAVQTLLGHSKPETTAIYTRVPDGALRAALDSAAI